MAERRNLILLTIDAWRPDFVDAFEGVPLTPALDAWRSRTVRFAEAFANAPWTSPALLSVFSGLPAHNHGVHHEWSTPRRGGPALAVNLAAAGWHVPNLCYLNRLTNYDNLGYPRQTAPMPPLGPEDPLLLAAIAATPEPFFLWFHYKFVHLPYHAAAPYRQRMGLVNIPARLQESVGSGFVVPRHQFALEASDRDLIRRMYAASVLQMNDWLAKVLQGVTDRRLEERTAIVLTSDHGEELMEHGHVGHASTAHHATLFDEVLRVPLLVLDPQVTAPRTLQRRVQGLDLFPTLHRLAGLAAPPCAGVDLTPAIWGSDEPAMAADRPFAFHSASMGCPTPPERASECVEGVSDGRHKLIVERFGATRTALYDLGQDPGELRPMQAPEAEAGLLEALRQARGAESS